MPTSTQSSHVLPRQWLLLLIGISAFVFAGLYALLQSHIANERALEEAMWRERLSLEAHAHAEKLAQALASKEQSLRLLAEDTTLRLYLTAPPEAEASVAYRHYLRNYLIAIAGQGGFETAASHNNTPKTNSAGEDFESGVAVVIADGSVALSTSRMPSASVLKEQIQREGVFQFLPDFRIADSISAMLLWRVPVYPVQAGEGEGVAPVGYVLGLWPAKELATLLIEPEAISKARSQILYAASPQAEWQNLVDREPASDALNASEAGFTLNSAALTFSQKIPGTDWLLLRRITYADAFGEFDARMRGLEQITIALAIAILLLILMLWRHVSAHRLAHLLQKVGAHEELLSQILKATPSRIFITDQSFQYHFANNAAAAAQHCAPEAMIGKNMPAVMGRANAASYQIHLEKALQTRSALQRYSEDKDGDTVREALNISHLPLERIPSPSGASQAGVLTIEHDVTELVRHQLASQKTLNRLLEVCLLLADKRDPNAAEQSKKVSALALDLAETMKLDAQSRQAARMAGLLLNIGKLMVPESLLVSEKAFSTSDKAKVKTSLKEAMDYLSDIPFDSPVIDSLRQSEERPDGKGVLGLREDDTLIAARIIKVANSFVALTSPRTYREALDPQSALEMLQKKAGSEFSQKVVTALAHYLHNLKDGAVSQP